MVANGDNPEAFFPASLVQQTLWLNHDEKGEQRRKLFEGIAEQVGLDAERVHAIYGTDLPVEEQETLVQRVRGRMRLPDGTFFGNVEKNVLPLSNTPLEQIDTKGRLGVWGCQASHIKAIKQALARVDSEKDNRWVILLEDDVKLDNVDRDALLKGLNNAPEDAGAVMLTSQQRLWSGAVPVETGNDNFVKPVQATSTAAIAFRPEMLRRLLPVYEANLKATREDGGVIAIDHVNSIIQEYITLGNEPPAHRPEMRRLINIFKEETAGKPPLNFYSLNPSLVPVHEISSTIGEKSTSARMEIGNPLTPVDLETARQMRVIMPALDKSHMRQFARDTIDGALKQGKITPEEALGRLEDMKNYLDRNAQRNVQRSR